MKVVTDKDALKDLAAHVLETMDHFPELDAETKDLASRFWLACFIGAWDLAEELLDKINQSD